MATRSIIAVKTTSNVYKTIYVHFDGDTLGNVLGKHYTTITEALAIVELGDCSYITPSEICAYHRDKGEAFNKVAPITKQTVQGCLNRAENSGADYLYVHNGICWETTAL